MENYLAEHYLTSILFAVVHILVEINVKTTKSASSGSQIIGLTASSTERYSCFKISTTKFFLCSYQSASMNL